MGTTAEMNAPPVKPARVLGFRHLTMLLLFLATAVAYAARVTLSVAIVAMTTPSDHGHAVFDWERGVQDTMLSSFFWGYVVLQLPAGLAAARWGGKWFVFTAIFSNGLLLLILPVAVIHGGWTAAVGCRILQGLTQGILYPSLHGLLGHWAPAAERSRMGTFVYAGAQLGTVAQMAVAGVLAAGSWGWPGVFQATGVICLLWAAAWALLGASTPAISRFISWEERVYIETYAGTNVFSKEMSTPWRAIWTSLPFWSILLSHAGQSLGFWTLLTEMPSYMAYVLDVDIKSNGLLSALPYVMMYLLSWVFSWAADAIVNSGRLGLTTVRKIFNTIALWGPAAALVALSTLPAGQTAPAVALLTVTVGLNAAHYVGFMMSHIDIAPNFSSALMGVTNGVGNIFSILAPYTVTLVVRDQNSSSEWQKVFYITIGFYFLSNLFYLLFASGKKQHWNEPVTGEIAREKKANNTIKHITSNIADEKV